MDGAGGTASLRKSATHWSLAGDKQLLDLLQNLHERIVTKCQEANSSLEEMVNTLDTASISLQNVNNKLMALSNSQFIESRVYEDDVDVATADPPTVKEPPKAADPSSELVRLRDSLRVLEAYHEPVTILDSDSDSGSEDDDRMVFKPKDLYSDRPLPYIIGSQQWRNKWHAGLVAEESDTDSDTSKANPPSEQYSDSEPDADGEDGRTDIPHASQRTISTPSSMGSELTIPTVGRPADIAAELARRLAGNVPHVPEQEPEPESPPRVTAPTKVYRPQQPTTATIFSDEPPPLESYQSDEPDEPDEPDQSDEDDVFAELHRTSNRQTDRSNAVVDQLFGNVSNVYGRKNGFDDKRRQSNPSVKQPSPLFEEPQDSELFADKSRSIEQPVNRDAQQDTSVKKPVGGISLFGNNHGAESIGAAILKRNQRKSSISDEEVEEPPPVNKINDDTDKNKEKTGHNTKDDIQKDLINDLFAKPNKTKPTNKRVSQAPAVKKENPANIEKPVNKKVDLFNDDLFDDIDDIFTNVKPPVKENKPSIKKSLFDDDDDDLFANVAATSNKTNSKPEPKSKSIFDSDDDLFKEEIVENKAAKVINKSSLDKVQQDISNDGLFSKKTDSINQIPANTAPEIKVSQNTTASIENSTVTLNNKQDDSIANNVETTPQEIKPAPNKTLKGSQVKSIFDSDSDDDIFSDLKSSDNNSVNRKNNIVHNIDNTAQTYNDIDEDEVRKNKVGDIPRSFNSEQEINKQNDELFLDNSLFKQKEKRLEGKDIATRSTENIDNKTNAIVDKLEENNEKTDEALTENFDISSKIENNTAVYTEGNKMVSSTNSNESNIQNKTISSILSNTAMKTQLQSPSLFDEDDDFDDIFSKNSNSIISNKSDNKLESNSADHSSVFIINQDSTSDNKHLHTEKSNEVNTDIIKNPDTPIGTTKTYDIIESVGQITHLSNVEEGRLETDKPRGSNDDSKDVSYRSKPSSIGELDEPLPIDDQTENSASIPNESLLEESRESNIDFDNIPEVSTGPIPSDIPESVLSEPDIFTDIFSDVPPEFERPKEPKKSKNVNALFDDDSDDEALFFKKNEIISDEKPDVGFSSQDDSLFHIFHDEPPAMDVDFTQKSKKSLELPREVRSETNTLQTDVHDKTNSKPLFKKEKTQNEKDSDIFLDLESENITDEARKPVGKLKPMNFNINVNSLLPGASPKKNKTYEQIDGQVISSKSIENVVKEEPGMVKSVSFEGDPESEVLDNTFSKERAKIQVKRRPSTRRARKEAVRKSGIDFGDDSTDTSTSTDISKKDDHRNKAGVLKSSNNTTTSEKYSNTSTKHIRTDKTVTKILSKQGSNIDHDDVIDSSDIIEEKQVPFNVDQDDKLFNKPEANIADHPKYSDNSISNREKQDETESSNLTSAFNKRPNVKSKVVYILNDEDIFTNTKPDTNSSVNINEVINNSQSNKEDTKIVSDTPDKTQNISENIQNAVNKKVLNIVDDDDELFKPSASKKSNIKTLGNAYKVVNLKNNKIDDFDSDEDIFKASQSKSVKTSQDNTKTSKNKNEIDEREAKIDKLFVKSQSSKGKSSLFDDLSDDESELFGSKKSVKNADVSDNNDVLSTIIKKEVKLPKNDKKQSLFGDDTDDDNLFGVKTNKKESSQPSSKPKEVSSKPAEPVFEDPLSLLTQDDDI